MQLFRRRIEPVEIVPAAIPVPRFSIDGWTLTGTPLADKLTSRLPRPDLRELETLLHGIAVEVDTPYTYERAAVLLERCDESGPALSVCEAWLAHPASKWPEYAHHSRSIERHRARLRARLASRPLAASG
ncbi:MAG TPA: hypothetical protein VEX89_02475 [Actinomycetes bacterium]|nr:hypothetical protein [Actinomycetes bacterium]